MRRLCPAVFFGIVVLFSSECSAKPPAWVEVRSPNFIVVSNAGEKHARKVAVQFEQIRCVFRQLLENANRHPSPLVTILAVKDESSMRELLPEYWTKAHTHPVGLFSTRLSNFYAAVQLDALNPYETIYHEYYHTISVPYVPNLPVWLSEGLAEFYGHTEITENAVRMGQADALSLQELRNTTFIPLDVLFKVDQSSPYYNEANKTSVFYGESWLLVHYLLIGDRMAHRPMLDAYLKALGQVSDPYEAAKIAFGDLGKLQSDLQTYTQSRQFLYLKYPAPRINEDEMKFRTLSDAEASAYRGGFAVVRGQYQEGKATLNEALQQEPNIGLAHQYLAVDEFFENQHDQAVESASKAIALDPNNWFTRYFRAYLKTSAGGMGSSDPQIEDDLRRAIAISPEFAPPYGLLAAHFAAGNRNLDEALTLAQKAVALEPASSNYQFALAQVLICQGKVDQADMASRRASAWARDPSEKANADDFRQFLDTFRALQGKTSAGGMAPQILPAQAAQTGSPSNGSSTAKLPEAGNAPSASPSGKPLPSILRVQSNLSILSNPMGVDFGPYSENLIEAIQKNLMSSVSSLRLGGPKDITLELVVLKDGTISAMKVVSSSGNDAVDQSTQTGITLSRPLPPLPGGFNGRSLNIRLQLSYLQEHY
jgi:TonB family protein